MISVAILARQLCKTFGSHSFPACSVLPNGKTRGRDTTKKQIASSASERDTTKKPAAAKRIAKKPATESDDDRKTTIAADSNESNQGSEQEEEEEEKAEEEVAEESPGHGDGDAEEVENGDDESECGECFEKIKEDDKRFKRRRLHKDCGGASDAYVRTMCRPCRTYANLKYKQLSGVSRTNVCCSCAVCTSSGHVCILSHCACSCQRHIAVSDAP